MKSRIASSAVFAVWLTLLALPGSASAFGPVASLVPYGSGSGQAILVAGIAVGPDGTMYLADYGSRRVGVFSSSGTFVRAFGKDVNPMGGNVCTTATGCKAGATSEDAGGLNLTTGIDLGPDGLLYVADDLNNRISVFSPDGTFVRAFGKEVNPSGGDVCTTATKCRAGLANASAGSLRTPLGLGIDSAGILYVAATNNRVDVFSPDGTFLRAFGKNVNPSGGTVCTTSTGCQKGTDPGSAGGVSSPRDIAVSPDGQVVLSDTDNFRISIFSPDGTFIRAFGKGVSPSGGDACTMATGCQQGKQVAAAGGFMFSTGIAIDGAGNLLIADLSSNRIDEFTFDGTFIRAFGEGVIDGKPVFQVCTTATGCVTGGLGTNPGSIPSPFSVAVDCTGAIYATRFSLTSSISQVERFGEPAAETPPCLPPLTPVVTPAVVESPAGPSPVLRHRAAKPTYTVELNNGSGTATLTVIVSDLGTLWLRGKGIRTVKQRVKRIGLVELQVTPTGAVKRKLERTGKAAVKVLLTFKPDEGGSSTQAKTLSLKMAPQF